jgi:hypothetical protein
LLFLDFLATSITPLPRLRTRQQNVDQLRQHIIDHWQYAIPVASRSSVKRITAALSALDAADGPLTRLEAARQLREAAEEIEAAQVAAARKAGATWTEIGACYGLTKQGAQQRFRAARNQAKAATTAPDSRTADPAA